MQRPQLVLYVGSLPEHHQWTAARYCERIVYHRIAPKAHKHRLRVALISREMKIAYSLTYMLPRMQLTYRFWYGSMVVGTARAGELRI